MYAAFARLLSSFSITRFELLLHTQGTSADFCTWALKLKDVIPTYPTIGENMNGIIERGINEDDFLVTEIRLNAISSCIINYTSSTEYFLVDLIKWKLRDKRLLRRAMDLKDIAIKKFDIIEFEDIEKLREKYINHLAGEFSFGTLWSKKLGNTHKLFDLSFDKHSNVIKSIDSVWEQRNKLAHLNRINHLPMSFTDLNGDNLEIKDLKDNDDYLKFCIELIKTINASLDMLDKFQQRIMEKWLNF
ncbi:hypothetical protein [Rufibacter latericius]|uniref:RiboL-PSP-HEPN domain-containing protein n=1 Tax=Rufibacter latericius TaxID=2487040 RepID=A0A3M9MT77_9BACT|nr:hypothetical protein [Rufibacter latericius]RNI28720.1 hypothetical protein EFB08_08790 [Rufibacter latericius]